MRERRNLSVRSLERSCMNEVSPTRSPWQLQAGTSRIGCRVPFEGGGNNFTKLCCEMSFVKKEKVERTSVNCNDCICCPSSAKRTAL